MKPQMTPATVLKFGGELLEDAAAVAVAAATIVRLARAEPVVVVHGGGRAIDAELRTRGATVATGVFGAKMAVASVNDGPFTVLVEVPPETPTDTSAG